MSTHLSYSFAPLHVCQSVCDTLPCTRFSVFFFCICMPVYLPVRHIHTHNVFHMCLCVCVFASICPYIMFTAMCPCVYLTVLIVFDYIVLAISTVVVLTTNVAVLAYRCMLRTLSFLTQRQRCFVHVSSFYWKSLAIPSASVYSFYAILIDYSELNTVLLK